MSDDEDEIVPFSKRNKRKPFYQFIKYLKHAEECQRGKVKYPVIDSYKLKDCKSILCSYVDLVITHKAIMNCQMSKTCNITSCYSSLKLFSHCKECTTLDCFICFLVKGKRNNSAKQVDDTDERKTHEDLDAKCAVCVEESTVIVTSPCMKIARTIGTQTEESIPKNSSVEDEVVGKININKAYVPGGLIIEKIKSGAIDDTNDSQPSSVSSAFRMTQINGFIQTIMDKSNLIPIILDKKLLYFFMYITSIEKEVFENSNSKEQYLKALLGKIRETADQFKDYTKKQDHISKQESARFYFKEKIIEMFGSDELKEIIFPALLTLRLEEPKTKGKKRWQKYVADSEREDVVLKICSRSGVKSTFLSNDVIDFLSLQCQYEDIIYQYCDSKENYYKYLISMKGIPSRGKVKQEQSVIGNEEDKKISLEKSKRMLEQFPENNITEILNDETEKDGKKNEVLSTPSVFCCSHTLLLSYSVGYQLWKKSEEKS